MKEEAVIERLGAQVARLREDMSAFGWSRLTTLGIAGVAAGRGGRADR